MGNIIVSIHQPNFMPWLGYFYKIWKSDIFIFLDDVQFIKTGASYTNRVSLNIAGESTPVTIPVKRPSGVWNINQTEFANERWKKKLLKTIQGNYAKSPYFKANREFIFELINRECSSYSEYNIHFVKEISKRLGFETEFRVSSEIDKGQIKNATDRIVKLVKSVNGTHYLSGKGGDNYQDNNLYIDNKIELIYNDFVYFEYKQPRAENFIKGLSIIDAVFNIGFENLKREFVEINNKKDNR